MKAAFDTHNEICLLIRHERKQVALRNLNKSRGEAVNKLRNDYGERREGLDKSADFSTIATVSVSA